MPTKPTISQIADLSGVSIATVSRFINHTAVVKGSTARKIMDAIQSLEYPLPENFITTNQKKRRQGDTDQYPFRFQSLL